MIEYCVYWTYKSIITGQQETFLQGKFLNEKNAKLFLKALKKINPNEEYFIDKWDTENKCFIK